MVVNVNDLFRELTFCLLVFVGFLLVLFIPGFSFSNSLKYKVRLLI